SIAAYRKSIELEPTLGEAYWSLANLKRVRFTPEEVAQMRAHLENPDLAHVNRFHCHFALGRALEDAGEFAEPFAHYEQANRLRRSAVAYSAEETSAHVQRSKALFTRQ